jgi:hypothetical protein
VCGGVLSLGVEVIARGKISQQESETIIVNRKHTNRHIQQTIARCIVSRETGIVFAVN